MSKKGFTLIELLVVIAIIGILSSIVLVALRGAKNKAKDARLITDMSQVRSVAELVYDGDYDALANDPDYGTLQADLTGTELGSQTLTLNVEAGLGRYCAQVTLNESGSYCVDSAGYAGIIAVCDSTAGSYDCATD